jgi:hypothetical protein
VVLAQEHVRLVGVQDERLRPREVFLAGAEELLDGGPVVPAVDPAVPGAELEAPELRIRSDRVDGAEQPIAVHAVPHRPGLWCLLRHHGESSVRAPRRSALEVF